MFRGWSIFTGRLTVRFGESNLASLLALNRASKGGRLSLSCALIPFREKKKKKKKER